MTRRDKDGKTRLKVIMDILEQTGIVAPELENLPKLPSFTAHIWGWFCDLSRSRTVDAYSVGPIAWTEISAYFKMIGLHPLRWELNALAQLDICFIQTRQGPANVATSAAAMKTMGANNG